MSLCNPPRKKHRHRICINDMTKNDVRHWLQSLGMDINAEKLFNNGISGKDLTLEKMTSEVGPLPNNFDGKFENLKRKGFRKGYPLPEVQKIIFKSGKIGFKTDRNRITKVFAGTQASSLGVGLAWRIFSVDGKFIYDKDDTQHVANLFTKVSAENHDYTVFFEMLDIKYAVKLLPTNNDPWGFVFSGDKKKKKN